MKKLIIAISIIIFTVSFSYSQGQWIGFNNHEPEEPGLTLLSSDNANVSFELELYGMYSFDTTVQSVNYQRLFEPGCILTNDTGKPELPVISKIVAIPRCDSITISFSVNSDTTIENRMIFPVPRIIEIDSSGMSWLAEEFYKDTAFYALDTNYRGLHAEIKTVGYLRDQRFAEVHIYPFQYNPTTQNLQVVKVCTVSLGFVNSSGAINVNTGVFNQVAANNMINYVSSGINASVNDRPGHTGTISWINFTDTAQACTIEGDYLIITDGDFFEPSNPDATILEIANHRAQYNGFDIAIVKVEDILNSNFYDPSIEYKYERAIRKFIKRVYEGENASNMYDGKLGYVLLVGDAIYEISGGTDFGVPTSYETFNPIQPGQERINDYYYSCLTEDINGADWIGDLFIGRLSVRNHEHLHNFISKIVYFESEADFGTWRDSVYFANSDRIEDNIHDNVKDKVSAMDTMYISDPYYVKKFDEFDYTYGQWQAKRLDFVNIINQGCLLLSYYGHSTYSFYDIGHSTDLSKQVDTLFLINNLSNKYMYPFVFNQSCMIGYFTGYYKNCLSEVMTYYSDTAGFVGMVSATAKYLISGNEMTYPPDKLKNGYLPYSIFNKLTHIAGEFILDSRIKTNEGGTWLLNYFGDPALNIMAKGFEITRDLTLPCEATISTDIYVREGVTLTISGCNLEFEENGSLTINEGATLRLFKGCNIIGQNAYNKIILKGDLQILLGTAGNFPCTLTSPENMNWTGIILENASNTYSLHDVVFERCGLEGVASFVHVKDCEFHNGGIDFHEGKIQVDSSQFSDGYLKATYGQTGQAVIINGCTFNNQNSYAYPIFIDDYEYFDIQNNTVAHNETTGIAIYNSKGSKGAQVHRLYNNVIYSNTPGGSSETSIGVKIFNSHADFLDNNYIYNNNVGIACYNTSELTIFGDCNAMNVPESQRIINNAVKQIYTTSNSFPTLIKYNSIFDDQGVSYYIYYDDNCTQYPEPILDVEDNYWSSNFDPEINLHPTSAFDYDPVWGFGCLKNVIAGNLYNEAVYDAENGIYDSAESKYRELVLEYTDTKYAKAGIKELFALKDIHDQDYEGLQMFLDTTSVLQDTTSICKLAGWISNKCDVKLENYQQAVDWYEDIISDPETEQDSIFAIIDLGYVYLLMGDSSSRSGINCSYPQYIPSSRQFYEIYRDKLLGLLLVDNNATNIPDEKYTENNPSIQIESIYPNPFYSSFVVIFVVKEDITLNIELYDITGKLMCKSTNEQYNIGKHKVEIDYKLLPKGLYNCILNDGSNPIIMRKVIKL